MALQGVQKRFTRMLPGMEGISYEEKLNKLGLERWRLRGDLIEVYKIMRGIDRVNNWKLFPRTEMTITREHKLKIRGERFSGDVRGSFLHRGWWGPRMHCQVKWLRQTH